MSRINRIYRIDANKKSAQPMPEYDHLTFEEKDNLHRSQDFTDGVGLVHAESIDTALWLAIWINNGARIDGLLKVEE